MNIYGFALLLTACLFGITQGAWTTPMELTERTNDSTFPDMYVDPVSKISHVVWIDNKSGVFKLAYSRVFLNRTKSTPIFLETAHRPRISHITGADDGKHIMVAFDAKRSQGDKNACAGGDSTGCYEIFFTESMDAGVTWSKPVMIEHDVPADIIDRKGPRMVYVKEASQVFVTYWRSGPMAFSRRIGDSGKFTKESVFSFSTNTAYQSIAYTIGEKNEPILHFFYVNWTYPTENIMYTQSSDAGKAWVEPKCIAVYKHSSTSDAFFRPFTVAKNDVAPKSVFIAFILNNDPHMMWTHDNGKTWSSILSLRKGNGIAPRIQLCRGTKGQVPKIYLLYSVKAAEKGSNFITGAFDVKTHTYKDEESPFPGFPLNWDYMVDCYEDGKKVSVQAIVENEKDHTNLVFLSYNDKPTALPSTYAD